MGKIFILLLTQAALPAAAAQPGGYDYGMEQRKTGDYAGAKATFLGLLLNSPSSAGALEGLGLSCIGLGQYEEAALYLEQWDRQSPDNPYILGLLARARNGMNDDRGALRVYKNLAALDPRDCAARDRVETISARAGYGVFPRARLYHSLSQEGLGTSSPVRIIYEGNSAGAGFRAPLKGAVDVFGGIGLNKDAQRNADRGFTYFEVQELSYSAGLAGRYGRGLYWEGEVGRSLFTDVSAPGSAGFVRGSARARFTSGPSMLELATAPRLLRVTGAGRFYRVPREDSARAQTAFSGLGWDWALRGGLSAVAGGTALGSASLRGTRDYGPYGLSAGYWHGQREFYSAAASGRLRYVQTDHFSAGASRGVKDVYRAGASLGRTFYSDGNRLASADASLTAWLPWRKEFYGGYRFEHSNYALVRGGYDTVDATGNWFTAGWRRCAGYNWSADAVYEHGFVSDKLMYYNADIYTLSGDWYSGRGSLRLEGRRRVTTGRGNSWSAGLKARYSF